MKKQILFLCVGNSARSQMAEGLARLVFESDEYHIESAGSHPTGTVNPLAIQVMRENDIDLSSHNSKSWESLSESFMKNLDYVITLCAEDACPILPLKARKLNWAMEDPKGLESFRSTRDAIRKKIEEFKLLLESN